MSVYRVFAVSAATSSRGRGVLVEQLLDRRKRVYGPMELRRWMPVPAVKEMKGHPGEMGKPVNIPSEEEAHMKEKFKINQFNLQASERISLNRSLPDVRLEA